MYIAENDSNFNISNENLNNMFEELLDLKSRSMRENLLFFGIKEDVGVFANYGNTGASKAWDATLKVLLNIQSNEFTNPSKVLILGHLDFSDMMEKVKLLDQNNKKDITKARKKVAKIDRYVTDLVYQIVKAGKTPIIIGGGHNNAYGNIKGLALAKGKAVNVVNFDKYS